ncbi:MAG: SDR family NAD(P)-dependent oxidoreductase [Niabella sp.]
MPLTVLITGATSGIGESCAKKFAANGYNLILTGRREERLVKLSKELTEQYHINILPLTFDVQDRVAVQGIFLALPPAWQQIDILINNAGLALGKDNFEDASLDDWDTMVDTNLKGLAYVTKSIIPLMIKAGKGHIFNLGSIAAKDVYAQGNMYCATKHAVGALSEAMRIDLLQYNIRVTAIHPGAANTEFSTIRFKGDKNAADNVYDGIKPLVGEDVANIIYYCATLPPHVCINDLVVTCTQQANSYYSIKK